jgi:predicted transcriptional regulator of viral defense system
MSNQVINHAIQLFSAHDGILKTGQALVLGISPRTLYAMRDSGLLRQISRGTFQLAAHEPLGNPDLVSVAKRIPKAVICLISALHFYGLTSQIPHKVYIALPQSSEKPRFDFPPLDIIWLSEKIFTAGITEQSIDGIPIKIYSIEKTIADCFKFRNKTGNDVALEALKEYLKMPRRNIESLLSSARIDRVETLLTPYLEALL